MNFRSVLDTPDGPERLVNSFYGYLFGDNPELRQLFPAAMDMQRHRFLTALTAIVDGLDDTDRIIAILEQLGRDHRKYGVEGDHYEAAGQALYAALAEFTGPALWTDSIDDAWRDVITLIVYSMADGADTDDLPPHWDATVLEHHRVLDDLAIVRLESEVPFEAGQYLPVLIPQRPRMWRYLSPAIPHNQAGQLEFHVRRVSGGWVSPSIVNETQPGDRWALGAPLGGLKVDLQRDVLMIGSGTGLAPLRAQVMEMAMRGTNPRVHLFVGGRYPCDLYDVQTLWQISLSNPWLTVVPVTEQDADPWWNTKPVPETPEGMHRTLYGPIGEVVASFGTWSDRQIQIAGSPTMIRDTTKALLDAGTPSWLITHDPV